MIQQQSDRMGELMKEEFEDTKGVIRIGKSKKNRQRNGQNNLGTNHLTCRGGGGGGGEVMVYCFVQKLFFGQHES